MLSRCNTSGGKILPGREGFICSQKSIRIGPPGHFRMSPPGRPIVSDCGSESYGVAEFITWHLGPLLIRHTSYVRDTYDFLEKVQGMRIGPGSSLFSMDVESLYTNIEIERGLEAVVKCLWKYPKEGRPDQSILRLLELSLRRNDFGFNGRHFLQVKV